MNEYVIVGKVHRADCPTVKAAETWAAHAPHARPPHILTADEARHQLRRRRNDPRCRRCSPDLPTFSPASTVAGSTQK